jgi:hypothetical protein
VIPEANPDFVAVMEDVLETYQRPRDPDRPLVCLNETSKQLIAETRAPIPLKPGQPARHDYEYQRNGVSNLFMIFAPLEGWRRVEVTDHHTAVDHANVLKELSYVHFAAAKKIVLVRFGAGKAVYSEAGVCVFRLSYHWTSLKSDRRR